MGGMHMPLHRCSQCGEIHGEDNMWLYEKKYFCNRQHLNKWVKENEAPVKPKRTRKAKTPKPTPEKKKKLWFR